MRDGVKRSLELLRSGSFDAALARIAIDMTGRGLEALSDDRAIDAWLMEMIGDTGHSAAPAGWARPTTRGLWSTPGGGCSASRIWVAEASVFPAVPRANAADDRGRRAPVGLLREATRSGAGATPASPAA
jgi:5-(hydroxymethyl)furfural/furfural oxidase